MHYNSYDHRLCVCVIFFGLHTRVLCTTHLHSMHWAAAHLQGDCKNAGKVVLAAVPSNSAHVYLFEVDDEVRYEPGTLYSPALFCAMCLCSRYMMTPEKQPVI